MANEIIPITKIAVFRNREIRKTVHNNEWWFSIVDVCWALTDSLDAGAYWRKLKQRLKEEGSEVVTVCHGLKLEAPDGKMRDTDCANTEGMFRIIQSIPSPKAEPFKLWLAKVGCERVKEIEDPELATKHTRLNTICHSREGGNPDLKTGFRVKPGMTKCETLFLETALTKKHISQQQCITL